MDNVMTGFQYGIPPCAGQSSHSFLRHNHVVVVANLLHPPGVARKPAQPRALGHNACGVGEGEGENREWTLGDVNGGTPLRSGVDPFGRGHTVGGRALTDFPRGVRAVTVESGWGRTQQMRTDPIARVGRSKRVRTVAIARAFFLCGSASLREIPVFWRIRRILPALPGLRRGLPGGGNFRGNPS